MGLVNQTITFSAGIVPTASAWTNQFTTLYNLVNGQLDSANVDKVSSDGIMVLDTAQTRTAALTMSQAGLAFSGAISASAWTTNGLVLKTAAATYTDTSTAGSGTSASAVINSFGVPTLAATNASVTTTDAATVYIAGAPAAGTNQTLTNAYSLWVDAGAVRLDGSLTASGGGSLTGTWSDLGTVTTVDINGGTIDGATIGGASAGAGTFTTLAGTTSVVAASDITITSGSILSASGTITFGDENLSTTGTLGAGATTVTSLLASSDDVGAIGASGTAFSDLFLASGAVVNFNAGNVSLTHATDKVTMATTGASATSEFLLDASGTSGTGRAEITVNAKTGVGSRVAFAQAGTDIWLAGAGAVSDGGSLEFYDVAGGITPLAIATGGSAAFLSTAGTLASFGIAAGGAQALAQINLDASASSGTGRAEIQINAKTGVGSRLDFQQGGTSQWLVGAGAVSDGTNFEFYSSANVLRMTTTNNVMVGTGAIATTATDGFLYIPSCAGAPTGVPTDYSNLSAMVHDTTNNRFYLYDHVSNAWQYAALT